MSRASDQELLAKVPKERENAITARHIARRLGLGGTGRELTGRLSQFARNGVIDRELRGHGHHASYHYWRPNGRKAEPARVPPPPPAKESTSETEARRLRRMIGNVESLRMDYQAMPDAKMERLCRLERQRLQHMMKFVRGHPDG